MLTYRTALLEALAEGKPVSDSAIARDLSMRRATISEWRRRDTFMRWLYSAIERQTDQLWPLILANTGRIALKGSIDHIREFARWKAPLPAHDFTSASAGDHTALGGIVINLPRPPSALAGHRVVVAMLDAATAEPAKTPTVIDAKP